MSIKRLPPEAIETFSVVLHPKRRYSARKRREEAVAEALVWAQSSIGTLPDTYSIRDGAHLVAMDSGRLLLIGGWNPNLYDGSPTDPEQIADWTPYDTTNEVWASDDGGENWTLLHAHDPSAVDRFKNGHTMGVLKVSNDVYVIGGNYGGTNGEVWKSTDEGATWSLVTNTAPTTGRLLGIFGYHDGAFYVMGGQSTFYGDSGNSEVWRSTDGCLTWTQLADAPWEPRSMVYNAVSHRGYLYLVGGGRYGDDGDIDPAKHRFYFNDVWRFDGSTWTEILADGHAQWGGRQYHNVVSTGTRLWVMCGYGPHPVSADNLASIAYSDNGGASWTAFDDAAWGSSHADATCYDAVNNRIIRAMGNGNFNAPYPRTIYQIAPVVDTPGSSIDPATLSPTALWQDFAGSPWSDSIAAANLTGGTTVGANFGSHPSADFNGTTQSLASTASIDTLVGTTAYTFDLVIECDDNGADAGAAYDEALIVGDDGGNFGVVRAASGVRLMHYDGGGYGASTYVATPTTGTKFSIQGKYNGTDAMIRVNGGAWTTLAGRGALAVAVGVGVLKLGVNYDGTKFFNGRVGRIVLWNTAVSDANLDGVYQHARSNFAVP